MREVEIQGETIHVDDSKRTTWHMFELCGMVSDENASPFARLDAMFELVEYATDTTKADILAKFGGDDAELKDVMNYVGEIIQEITPKN